MSANSAITNLVRVGQSVLTMAPAGYTIACVESPATAPTLTTVDTQPEGTAGVAKAWSPADAGRYSFSITHATLNPLPNIVYLADVR